MRNEFLLKDLKRILRSSTGQIQMGILYNSDTGEDISGGSIDYIVSHYGDYPVLRIQADNNDLVIYTHE